MEPSTRTFSSRNRCVFGDDAPILLNSFFSFLLSFSSSLSLSKKKKKKRLDWTLKLTPHLPPPPHPPPLTPLPQNKTKKVIIVEDKKWGPAERDALYKGLETFGVGGWRAMVDTLLPRWDETALRVKAGRLMGTQSLARYVGWKGGREAVDAEFARNKELGEATGCWKGGVLVEDDAGSVAAELARRAASSAAAAAAAAAAGGGAQ